MSFVSDFFYPTLWGPKITVWISHTLSILPDSSRLPDRASLIAQLVKNPGLIPGLGRSPGEGIGYPLQYSGLENSMDWIVHGATKSRTWLSNFHLSSLLEMHTWSVSNLEDCCKYSFSFNFFFLNFIWLGLCCSTWDPQSLLCHAGSISLTRERTPPPSWELGVLAPGPVSILIHGPYVLLDLYPG